MDPKRTISNKIKGLLEYGPLAIFFAAYILFKDKAVTIGGIEYSGFLMATGLFTVLTLLSTALLWLLTGHISAMQTVTAVMLLLFGGLSLWLRDERFFKMKPTAFYLLFAAILGFGLWRGKSYLQPVLGEALAMEPQGWMILTKRVACLFLALALANELVWRLFSTSVWVNFKTFGLTLILFAFLAAQGQVIQRYGIKKEGDE